MNNFYSAQEAGDSELSLYFKLTLFLFVQYSIIPLKSYGGLQWPTPVFQGLGKK